MPCSPRKARVLLKEGKAKVVQRTPFTIQLTVPTGETKQEITLGVDSGFTHVGLSAVSDKEELFSADVTLRTDIVKLNSERAMYRGNRRYRKTRYRKPRFLNRTKPKSWLAPSIQHKLDSHKKLISKVKGLLPITNTIIEVAAFDIQKIKNPEILGLGYQKGEQSGFWNVREYVLHRDSHKCQAPMCNHKDKVLNVHHLISRQTGGDRPNNLITLCETCHNKHHFIFMPHFRMKNDPYILSIGPQNFSLATQFYPGWSSFSEELFSLLFPFFSMPFFRQILRIGIRYINLFDANVFTLARLSLKLMGKAIVDDNLLVRVELKDDPFVTTLNVANQAAMVVNNEKRHGSVVDLDTYIMNPSVNLGSVDDVREIIMSSHDIAKNYFFSLLEDEFLVNLNPEYD